MSDAGDDRDLVRVCDVAELHDGERRMVEVDGREVGVLNVEGDYYAIANTCAHMGGPVCEGKVQGALKGEFLGPGKRVNEYFADELAIACPWHGWEYDLATGEHLGDDDIRIPTYDVVVEDGTVFVER